MISKKEVQHIAKLARLKLDPEEIEKMQKDLSSILDYFNLLKKVNVKNIKPTFHFKEESALMREDKTRKQSSDTINQLVEMAPDKKKRYIRVKSILR
jgi:aspartyl-tRNA(Asn)/glutamyl-tRNA(Gln) amidotransferase subunit C